MRSGSSAKVRVRRYHNGEWLVRPDSLAAEEPLEIRLTAAGMTRTLSVTMRTPGNDFELAAGLLLSEGVIDRRDDIVQIRYCVDAGEAQLYNVLNVDLRDAALLERVVDRQFYSSSACGVCGAAGIQSLEQRGCAPLSELPIIDPAFLCKLPEQLRDQQRLFALTGGLHGAALFDTTGRLLAVREDVGRHNAVDKLIGWALLAGYVPLHDAIMLVSGRVGYEIVQKCIVAGVPVLCAISAPSSMAVNTARAFNLTLVGFLRGATFNVYSAAERLNPPGNES